MRSERNTSRPLYNVRMRSTATLVVGACLAYGLMPVGQPQPPAAPDETAASTAEKGHR